MMSPMFVPKSIRKNRFGRNNAYNAKTDSIVESLSYIAQIIKRVVISEKYMMNPCLISFDVSTQACKTRIHRAFSCLSPDNEIIKITSLINRSTARTFRGKIGSTKSIKRICIRFSKPFDMSLIYDSSEDEIEEKNNAALESTVVDSLENLTNDAAMIDSNTNKTDEVSSPDDIISDVNAKDSDQ